MIPFSYSFLHFAYRLLARFNSGATYAYAYDAIGNRIQSSGRGPRWRDVRPMGHSIPAVETAYQANGLNQYTSRTVPGHAAVRGTADPGATVLVNGAPAVQEPPFFYGSVWPDNTLAAVLQPLEVTAVLPAGDAPGPDLVSTEAGSLFVPKTPEVFTYDLDGNLTSDGRFTYTWNAEIKRAQSPSPRRRAAAILRLARDVTSARARSGIPRRSGNCHRLTRAETLPGLPPSVPRHRIDYAYDFAGRMVSKQVSDATSHQQLETRNYIWDIWNIIAESAINHLSLTTNHCSYVWGLDLSGTLQGAGGVGGLLAVIRDGGLFVPAYDANGNVSEYVSLTDGTIAAHYEYDAFGSTVVKSGDLADDFMFRFSTKPYCAALGKVEFELRIYDPPTGRWMSRDPTGEAVQWNLYAFIRNNPVGYVDLLGLQRIYIGGAYEESGTFTMPDGTKVSQLLSVSK